MTIGPADERFGDASLGDTLRESLNDGGLADAGLAYQAGIVLRAAGEYLDDPLGLALTADYRVELALSCHLGEVAPVLRESRAVLQRGGRLRLFLVRGLILGVLAADAAEEVIHVVRDIRRGNAELIEYHDRDAVALRRDGEKKVLGADIGLTEARGLYRGVLDYPFRARGHIARSDPRALSRADPAADCVAGIVEPDAARLEKLRGDAVLLGRQREQKMLAADICVSELGREIKGFIENVRCFVGETLWHMMTFPAVLAHVSGCGLRRGFLPAGAAVSAAASCLLVYETAIGAMTFPRLRPGPLCIIYCLHFIIGFAEQNRCRKTRRS